MTIGKKVVFNYIDQARMQLKGTGSVLEEISDGSETVLFGEERLSARSYLRRFLFTPIDSSLDKERPRGQRLVVDLKGVAC